MGIHVIAQVMEMGIIAVLKQISICSRSMCCLSMQSWLHHVHHAGLVDSRLITTGSEQNAEYSILCRIEPVIAQYAVCMWDCYSIVVWLDSKAGFTWLKYKKMDRFGFIVQFQIFVIDILQTLENTSRLSWLITGLAVPMWYLWVVVAPIFESSAAYTHRFSFLCHSYAGSP